MKLYGQSRNKPLEAPKAPERAPFFLPTLPGVGNRFDFGSNADFAANGGVEVGKSSRRLDISAASVETEFVRKLMQDSSKYLLFISLARALAGQDLSKTDAVIPATDQTFFEYLKALSPAAIDLELRSLTILPHLSAFLDSLSSRLRSHRDFEAVQTFLAVFLKIQGDVLIANYELLQALEQVRKEQERESGRLMDLTHYALGTLAFLRSVAIA